MSCHILYILKDKILPTPNNFFKNAHTLIAALSANTDITRIAFLEQKIYLNAINFNKFCDLMRKIQKQTRFKYRLGQRYSSATELYKPK